VLPLRHQGWHRSCFLDQFGSEEAAMITQELLAKLRLENINVLARVDQLRVRAEGEGTPTLAHEVAMLRREMRDYVGLVDALVDALLPDAPKTRKAG
jgi:hypothetical protein